MRTLSGQRFFDLVTGTSLVYNQCWEDPALDREALQLTSEDRVLVITSAGCNALDYALVGARVVAVDKNARQNHLLELKLCGIRALVFPEFFELFGSGGSARAPELYARLRALLSAPARRYWDAHMRSFEPTHVRGGSFYYAGTSGLAAFALTRYLNLLPRGRSAIERLLQASDVGEQTALYERELRPRLLGQWLLRLVASPVGLSLLGVPASQRKLIERHRDGFAGYLRGCLDHVMSLSLLRDNYFWRVYVTGSYSSSSCPEYLKEANFERLKAGLVDNVSIRTATVAEALEQDPEPFTAFVLLDHMDWLAELPRVLEAEWRWIFARAGSGARAIFRSGGADAGFLPASIRDRLTFATERARELHRLDRVGTYGSFHIARLAA